MKKLLPAGLVIIALVTTGILIAPYIAGTDVLASTLSFCGPQFTISEPLGLIILGVGIIGLARFGRKRLIKKWREAPLFCRVTVLMFSQREWEIKGGKVKKLWVFSQLSG
jgi:hypothetical protein